MTTTDAPAADARLLVSPKEAADMLSLSLAEVYNLMNAGALASIKIGSRKGARRIETTELRAFIQRCKDGR